MSLKAAVIGFPIKHSLSPIIHNYWLSQFGIIGEYSKIEVAPDELANFIARLRHNGYSGVNITLPHKEAVLDLCDEVSERAKIIGAVNTIWLEGDKICGDNSDVMGFTESLDFKPDVATVLGAGGSARAVIYGLLQMGVREVRLVNRTVSRAEIIADDFSTLGRAGRAGRGGRVQVFALDDLQSSLSSCDLLVNCISLGSGVEVPFVSAPSSMVAYDISYKPYETNFLQSAAENNLRCLHGLDMLIHQAVLGFCKWFIPDAMPNPHDKDLLNILLKELG